MSRIEALITPSVLEWARKTARLRPDEAAKRLEIPEERLLDWEAGKRKPTVNQARKAAKVYGRPLAVFYLEEIPSDFTVIRDFRALPGHQDRGLFSYHVTLLIREIQARQEWARSIFQELGAPRLSFVKSVNLQASPRRVAESIRGTLGVSVEEQISWPTLNDALNAWTDHAERVRIFVSQTSARGEIPVEDARGFAVVDPYAPFVFLNAKDSLGGRIFTLAHELAHVWLGASGVSGADLGGDSESEEGQIEAFCNSVASEVVFPSTAFPKFFSLESPETEVVAQIEPVARDMSVSRDVVARRLLDRGLLQPAVYQRLHSRYVREWHAEQRKSKGGGNYYVTHVRALSKALVRLVGDVYSRGRITGVEASALLHAKLDNMTRLMRAAHGGSHD